MEGGSGAPTSPNRPILKNHVQSAMLEIYAEPRPGSEHDRSHQRHRPARQVHHARPRKVVELSLGQPALHTYAMYNRCAIYLGILRLRQCLKKHYFAVCPCFAISMMRKGI